MRAAAERRLSAEQAMAVVEAEYERHRLAVELTRQGPAEVPVYTCVVRDWSGRVVSRAAGKGLGAQSRASALFEGWEHLQLKRGLSRLVGNPSRARVLAPQQLLEQPALDDEAMLQRLAADYTDAKVGCLLFQGLSDPRSTLWYPAFVKSPWYSLCPVLGDDQAYEPYLRYASSNGTASGTGEEDALLHALLEIVERDALSLAYLGWFAGGTPGRIGIVEPSSLPYDLQRLRDVIAIELGAPPLLLDITTDLGIPAYCATPSQLDLGRPGLRGTGASLSPAYAAERALCELLQFATIRSAFDPAHTRRSAALQPWPVLEHCFRLSPTDLLSLPRQTVGLAAEPPGSGRGVQQHLDRVVTMLAERGYQSYRLNWHPEQSAVHVVAACVPGSEAFSIHVNNGVPVLPSGRGMHRLALAKRSSPA